MVISVALYDGIQFDINLTAREIEYWNSASGSRGDDRSVFKEYSYLPRLLATLGIVFEVSKSNFRH